jgi:legumain
MCVLLGINVYANVGTKDYTGNDVTPQNFLNVITGNAAAMAGIGSGRVLKSGVNDTVFINFDDHGGVGIICFPSTTLDAADLNKVTTSVGFFRILLCLYFY